MTPIAFDYSVGRGRIAMAKKLIAPALHCWRITLLIERRAKFFGYVEAADERAAMETAPKEFRILGGALSAGTFDRPDSRQVDGYQKRGRALPGLHQFDYAASENRSSSVADSMQRREFLSPGL